ncbi:MAG: substrate-binding domain-containing protein [Actinomycetes bacterium]
MRKSILAVAVAASASVVLASALAPAATAAVPTADKGVAAAQAIVKQYSSTPTSINITTPLKVSPKTLPTKLIVGLSNGGDENKTLDDGLAAGSATLGWTFKEISGADIPEHQRAAFQQALDLKPAGIHISGIEPDTLGDLLGKAKAAGIPVVCSACMSAPTSGLVDTHIAGKRQLDVWGRMIAAYVVAGTPAPNVEGVTVPLFPILIRFDEAFKNNLNILSGGKAVYHANPQQLTDIFAGKTPAAVVSAVQPNKAANWIVADLGGWVAGVSAALKTAGLQSQVQIGGLTAGLGNIAGLKDGTESAWTGYSLPIVGWTVIDSFARYFQKMPFNTKDLPTQVLTKANASSLVLTADGNYLGVKDYVKQFKKVWGVLRSQ